ncbi:Uncharacterized protein APZ42_008527, partial [Daphnia magna]
MGLVELLLEDGCKYVLTGKFNQDCIERFFGIMRSAGCSDEHPIVSSFLQLYRLMTLVPRYLSMKEILEEQQQKLAAKKEERKWTLARHTVYNLCGYLLHARSHLLTCDVCRVTLETEEELLREDFYYHTLTSLKNKGGLKFCTPDMFQVFYAIEIIYRENSNSITLARDAFDLIIDKLSESLQANLPPLCCPVHRSDLFMDYLILRIRLDPE